MNKENILNMFEVESKKSNYTWNTYQPINVEGYEKTLTQAGRFCSDRANKIIEHVKANISLDSKFIDWGCNNGYFIFELAKHGYLATGIDKNPNFIKVCSVANESFNHQPKPEFIVDELNLNNIEKYKADVIFCFSVLHHFKNHANDVLNKMSKEYKNAYIEMDGHNFGYEHLHTFYWNVDFICSANDKYGTGTRLRKTWYCSNVDNIYKYENVKNINLLGGRSIFKQINKETNEVNKVIKREFVKFKHSWINTNILHEIQMYSNYKTHFIPNMISNNIDEKFNTLELEYIDYNSDKGDSIENIYKWLKDNNLFLVDVTKDQFIKTKNGYVLVDLESLFLFDEKEKYIRKPIPLDSYDKQLNFLKKHLK